MPEQPVPDEAVQALTRFLQAEWAGPYMARASNFTREEVLAGALAAADAEAHGEAEAVARRGLEAAIPFIRAQVIREVVEALREFSAFIPSYNAPVLIREQAISHVLQRLGGDRA